MSSPKEMGAEELELAPALDSYAPVARPEFRRELRAQFLAGEDRTLAGSAPVRHRRWRLLAGGLGGALAAAAAVVLWLMGPAAPIWRIDARDGGFAAAGLVIDGSPVSADATAAEVERALATADTVHTAENGVRLVYGDLFVVEVDPDSQLDLRPLKAGPEAGPEAGRDRFVLAGDRGGFRFATGPGLRPPERTLEFRTPRVSVEVLSTVFEVDVSETYTCICCCEGQVKTVPLRAGGLAGLAGLVGRGETHIVMDDGTVDETRVPMHQARLQRLVGFWDDR